ncbi:MAG TPA: nucleotide exchange factor GrpE [Candidatus Paceibacterota bacterium]|jgi:molecular chaperone GrpE
MKKKKRTLEDVSEIEFNSSEAGEEVDASVLVKKLKKELVMCSKERKEYLEGWQRARAESINSKKVVESERERQVLFAAEELIADTIPVLDSFDMAFGNSTAWERVDENWRRGVEHIHTQLLRVLGEHGVTIIDPKGGQFDPSEHESVGEVKASWEYPPHSIVHVRQKGYRLQTKVLRPAKVEVAV